MLGSRVVSKLVFSLVAPFLAATLVIVGAPVPAFATSALPVVLSYGASKTSIPNKGGTVILEARLKYASRCEMSASERLRGFPLNFSCKSQVVRKVVVLPDNKGENPVQYTFGLTVRNAAGSTKAANAVVTEGVGPPPISFTTPIGSSLKTVVFQKEGVFVADDPLIVVVHNNSNKTQVISSVAIGTVGDESDFLLNRNNCGSVTPHANCSLAVQFQPTGAGVRTGVVDIVDSSWGTGGTTTALGLRGTGVWAAATVANANIRHSVLSFPNQGVLTPSPYQYLTLANVGSVPLYINTITTTGGEAADFNSSVLPITSNCPQIVSVGKTCTLGIAFVPTGAGYRSTNIVIDDNTLGTQTQLAVQGTGVYSTNTLAVNGDTPEPSPISFDFGSTPSGGSGVNATVTVRNTSRVTLVFNSSAWTGINQSAFTASPTATCASPGVELAAGQSCRFPIGFNPQTQGTLTATLHISDNSPDGGEVINLIGTGA